MQQTWKCDYCYTFGTSQQIEQHEANCSFNPSQKLCWTCANRFEEGAPISGYWNSCTKGKQCHEVEDNKQPCELWEKEQV